MDEEAGESLSRSHTVWRPGGLERADDGGPDGDDAVAAVPGAVHQVGSGGRDLERFRVYCLFLYLVRLDLEAAHAGVKEDGCEPNARGLERLSNLRGDGSRRGGHLRTPRHTREQALVRVEGPDLLNVTVVDRHSRALQDRLERPAPGGEPQPPGSPRSPDLPAHSRPPAGFLAPLP